MATSFANARSYASEPAAIAYRCLHDCDSDEPAAHQFLDQISAARREPVPSHCGVEGSQRGAAHTISGLAVFTDAAALNVEPATAMSGAGQVGGTVETFYVVAEIAELVAKFIAPSLVPLLCVSWG